MIANLSQLFTSSLELTILEVAVIIALILAIAVYRTNKNNATAKIFVLLSLSAVFWLIAAYIIRVPNFPLSTVLLGRLGIFFAAPLSTMFFLLGHTFPSEKLRLSKNHLTIIILGTLLMMGLNISPYAFTDVKVIEGSIKPVAGLGLIPFSILSTLFSILAVYFLIKKYRNSQELKISYIGYGLYIQTIKPVSSSMN